MKAKYEGICKVCQEKIIAGQSEIVRYKDTVHQREWVHESCASVEAIIDQAVALHGAITRITDNERFKKHATDDLTHIQQTPSFMMLDRMRHLLKDTKNFQRWEEQKGC